MAQLGRIALIGKSGAGKSEVASILRDEYGYSHVKTGAICRQISQLLFGNDSKTATQSLDDVLTKLDESIFLKAAIRELDLSRPFVLDALRFNSDAEIARELDCHILRVTADDGLRTSRLQARAQTYNPETNAVHRSETELDAYAVDGAIDNSTSLAELRAQVDALLRQ